MALSFYFDAKISQDALTTKDFHPPKCRLYENHTKKCMIFIQSGIDQFVFLHLDIIAEGKESESHKFEMLHSKWYSYDCNHHGHTRQKILKGDHNPSEYKPDNVKQNIHNSKAFLLYHLLE